MGWAAGSELMSDIMISFNNHNIQKSIRTKLYLDIIKSFTACDCDTLDECLESDESFDKAYYIIFPHHKP